jgi:hypothetical protein
MPGEKRLCTGCHDSHNRDRIIFDLEIQPSQTVLNRAANREYNSGFHNAINVMNHSAARTDTVDFFDKLRPNRSNTVQAVFNQRCISCHSAASPAGGLRLENLVSDFSNADETTSVYNILTEANYRTAGGQNINYVTDNGARRSPLLWVMYNRQLNDESNEDYRPLSYDHTQLWERDQNGLIAPFLPGNRDLLTLVEWVDAGTQYSNTTR